MKQWIYTLSGEPIALHMIYARNRAIWDRTKERTTVKRIELENQHNQKPINEPVELKITFYLPKQRYISLRPSLKAYINFIEQCIFGYIITKKSRIRAIHAEKKLSDADPHTTITITEMKL